MMVMPVAGEGLLERCLTGPATLSHLAVVGPDLLQSICCNCRREQRKEEQSREATEYRGANASICAAQQHWSIQRNQPKNKPGVLLTQLFRTVIGVEKVIVWLPPALRRCQPKAVSAAVDQRPCRAIEAPTGPARWSCSSRCTQFSAGSLAAAMPCGDRANCSNTAPTRMRT